MSISRILALCLIFCSSLCAVAQNDDIAERCGLLAARGDVAMLREVYDAWHDSLPKNTELYCRFAFARGRGDNRAISNYVDTLEAEYVDDLDLRGLLAHFFEDFVDAFVEEIGGVRALFFLGFSALYKLKQAFIGKAL